MPDKHVISNAAAEHCEEVGNKFGGDEDAKLHLPCAVYRERAKAHRELVAKMLQRVRLTTTGRIGQWSRNLPCARNSNTRVLFHRSGIPVWLAKDSPSAYYRRLPQSGRSPIRNCDTVQPNSPSEYPDQPT